jgi:hypothetical protein
LPWGLLRPLILNQWRALQHRLPHHHIGRLQGGAQVQLAMHLWAYHLGLFVPLYGILAARPPGQVDEGGTPCPKVFILSTSNLMQVLLARFEDVFIEPVGLSPLRPFDPFIY